MSDTSKPNALRAAAIYGLYIGLFLILCNLIGGGYFTMFIKLVGSIGLLNKGILTDAHYPTLTYIIENVAWFMPLAVFMWSMFLGLIYSLIISAAIVRKKSIFAE